MEGLARQGCFEGGVLNYARTIAAALYCLEHGGAQAGQACRILQRREIYGSMMSTHNVMTMWHPNNVQSALMGEGTCFFDVLNGISVAAQNLKWTYNVMLNSARTALSGFAWHEPAFVHKDSCW